MKRIKPEELTKELTLKLSSEAAVITPAEKLGENEVCFTIKLPYKGAYGMGEKYNRVNQRGLTSNNQIIEKFCYQGDKTYCTAPFFFTDSGFGLYIDTMCKTKFIFRDEILCVIPRNTELILFTGTPKSILKEYIELFGKIKLPPDFVFGPWISANRWNTQKQVEEQLGYLKKYHFPASVLVLEAWSDEATFYIFNGASYRPKKGAFSYEDFDFSDSKYWSDPKKMIENLHQEGLKLFLWQIPAYKKMAEDDPKNEQNTLDWKEAVEQKLCVRDTDGKPYAIPDGNWFEGSLIPDFTNSETKKSWFEKRQYLLDIGVDGFKTDGGEFIYCENLAFSNGMSGTEAKNRYSQEYLNAYTEFVGKERTLFSRAGYAGAHTTPIHWGGDQQSDNEEMKSVLKAGLSAALTGIAFWGFDIGGFAGPLPTLDLYRRATQMACFCPIMQWHSEPDGGQFKEQMPGGVEGNNERSPWNMANVYGDMGFIDEMRYWHELRMELIPYLKKTARECVENSAPMMQPLVYEYPEDKEVIDIEDQYLLGNELLAAPLMEENSTVRELYLPEGTWYGFFTGIKYEGKRWITSDAQEKCPVYLKDGASEELIGVKR